MLAVDNLTVRLGGATIIHNVSIHVSPGEAVAVLGPHGAGKTTVAHAIMGLVRPTSGSVRIVHDGMELRLDARPSWHRARLGVAFVPEAGHVFPDLTVSDNLLVALSWIRLSRPEVRQLLEQVTALFPALRERMAQVAGTMSGGEKRLLGIARALVSIEAHAARSDSKNFRCLIVDEPSHGLHPTAMVSVADVLGAVRNKGDVGILLLEQFAGFALSVSSRAYAMERGRVVSS